MQCPYTHAWVTRATSTRTADCDVIDIDRKGKKFDVAYHGIALSSSFLPRQDKTYKCWTHRTNGLYLKTKSGAANLIGSVLYTTGNAPMVLDNVVNGDRNGLEFWSSVLLAAAKLFVEGETVFPFGDGLTDASYDFCVSGKHDAIECKLNTMTIMFPEECCLELFKSKALWYALKFAPTVPLFNQLTAAADFCAESSVVEALPAVAVAAIDSILPSFSTTPYTGNAKVSKLRSTMKKLFALQIKSSSYVTRARYAINTFPFEYSAQCDDCRGSVGYRPTHDPFAAWVTLDGFGPSRYHDVATWLEYVEYGGCCGQAVYILGKKCPNAVNYVLMYDPDIMNDLHITEHGSGSRSTVVDVLCWKHEEETDKGIQNSVLTKFKTAIAKKYGGYLTYELINADYNWEPQYKRYHLSETDIHTMAVPKGEVKQTRPVAATKKRRITEPRRNKKPVPVPAVPAASTVIRQKKSGSMEQPAVANITGRTTSETPEAVSAIRSSLAGATQSPIAAAPIPARSAAITILQSGSSTEPVSNRQLPLDEESQAAIASASVVVEERPIAITAPPTAGENTDFAAQMAAKLNAARLQYK